MKRSFLKVMLAGAVALAVAGCGKNENSEPSSPTATVDPATAGSISGTVVLDGAPPALKPIDMSATPACVQANPSPVVPPIVVTGENGAMANVVVYVKEGLGHYKFDTPTETVALGRKRTACMTRTWSR